MKIFPERTDPEKTPEPEAITRKPRQGVAGTRNKAVAEEDLSEGARFLRTDEN
jgi:hypothetical protein